MTGNLLSIMEEHEQQEESQMVMCEPFTVCSQGGPVEYTDQAGHLEPSFSLRIRLSPWIRSLPHGAILQHQRQRICFSWEVSQSPLLARCW